MKMIKASYSVTGFAVPSFFFFFYCSGSQTTETAFCHLSHVLFIWNWWVTWNPVTEQTRQSWHCAIIGSEMGQGKMVLTERWLCWNLISIRCFLSVNIFPKTCQMSLEMKLCVIAVFTFPFDLVFFSFLSPFFFPSTSLWTPPTTTCGTLLISVKLFRDSPCPSNRQTCCSTARSPTWCWATTALIQTNRYGSEKQLEKFFFPCSVCDLNVT